MHDNEGVKTSKPVVVFFSEVDFRTFKQGGMGGFQNVKVLWDAKKKEATNEVLNSKALREAKKKNSLDQALEEAKALQAKIEALQKQA